MFLVILKVNADYALRLEASNCLFRNDSDESLL